jgi:hypothetical protein
MSVHVLALTVELHLPQCQSLKEKRAVLKSMTDGARRRYAGETKMGASERLLDGSLIGRTHLEKKKVISHASFAYVQHAGQGPIAETRLLAASQPLTTRDRIPIRKTNAQVLRKCEEIRFHGSDRSKWRIATGDHRLSPN